MAENEFGDEQDPDMILENEKTQMGPKGSEFELEGYLDSKPYLIKAKNRGVDVVIYKGIVNKIEARRPQAEFNCRTANNMNNLREKTKDCEYIVGILHCWTTGTSIQDWTLWTVMEYIENKYPADKLKDLYSAGTIKINDVVNFYTKLCEGVQCLHDADFIHRDIKYGNVLMKKKRINGTSLWIPKIIDFNLGKSKGSSTHTPQGTDGFMAPERIPWPENQQTWDVYSAAVMLWETLDITQRGTENLLTIKNEIQARKDKTRNFFDVNDQFLQEMKTVGSSYLTQVLKKGLASQPKDRYQSANAMMYDLIIASMEKQLEAALSKYAELNGMDKHIASLAAKSLEAGKSVAAQANKDLDDFLDKAPTYDSRLNKQIITESYLLHEGLKDIIIKEKTGNFWKAVVNLLDGVYLPGFNFSKVKTSNVTKDKLDALIEGLKNEVVNNVKDKSKLENARLICRYVSDICEIMKARVMY